MVSHVAARYLVVVLHGGDIRVHEIMNRLVRCESQDQGLKCVGASCWYSVASIDVEESNHKL